MVGSGRKQQGRTPVWKRTHPRTGRVGMRRNPSFVHSLIIHQNTISWGYSLRPRVSYNAGLGGFVSRQIIRLFFKAGAPDLKICTMESSLGGLDAAEPPCQSRGV